MFHNQFYGLVDSRLDAIGVLTARRRQERLSAAAAASAALHQLRGLAHDGSGIYAAGRDLVAEITVSVGFPSQTEPTTKTSLGERWRRL